MREVVSGGVEFDTGNVDLLERGTQFPQVRGACDFRTVWGAEHEVTKTHLLAHEVGDSIVQLGIFLVNEGSTQRLSLLHQIEIFRLETNRHIGM